MYCVYDSRGNLMKRFPTRKGALEYLTYTGRWDWRIYII